MASTMKVDVVSAEREIFSGQAEMVLATLTTGEIGVLPGHTPLIARLAPGEVRVRTTEKEELTFYISGGLVEVQPHVVTVLSDTALRAHDLDEAAALKAKEQAEEALKTRKSEVDIAKAQAELIQAAAQLRMIRKLREQLK